MRWQVPAAVGLVVVGCGIPFLYAFQHEGKYRNFRAVEDGVLYRSGQMPADAFDRVVKEYGIRTVVSLRDSYTKGPPPDLHEEEYCQQHGLYFDRISPAGWSAPDGSVPAEAGVDEFLALMHKRHELKPILIHCFAGLHRTGAQVAAYRMRYNGWSADEAIAEMQRIQPRRAGFQADMLGFLRSFPTRPAK